MRRMEAKTLMKASPSGSNLSASRCGGVVETRDRHEEVGLERRLLQQLQLQDEHDPEQVEQHQVAEDDAVAKRHEIGGGVFRLLLLVLVDRMQVHLDELLPERRHLVALDKSDLSVAERRRLLHPARLPQLVSLHLGRLRVLRLVFRRVLLDAQSPLLLLRRVIFRVRVTVGGLVRVRVNG